MSALILLLDLGSDFEYGTKNEVMCEAPKPLGTAGA